MMLISLGTLSSLSYLLIAMVDDLVFRKFHNWLFITLGIGGFALVTLTGQLTPQQASLGLLTGLACFLPLTLLKIVGAGDLKFMMCFGILLGPWGTFQVSLLSIFWGALLGLLKVSLNGELKSLVTSLAVHRQQIVVNPKHSVPYTIAIFLGWMTWTLGGRL